MVLMMLMMLMMLILRIVLVVLRMQGVIYSNIPSLLVIQHPSVDNASPSSLACRSRLTV